MKAPKHTHKSVPRPYELTYVKGIKLFYIFYIQEHVPYERMWFSTSYLNQVDLYNLKSQDQIHVVQYTMYHTMYRTDY